MQESSNIIDKNWKALIKPNKLEITSNEDKTIAKMIAEPLEKGFGQTIGNSLRRILFLLYKVQLLLQFKLTVCYMSFHQLKVLEKMLLILFLNVKNLAIKSSSTSSKKIILDIKGPKEVKAKDITLVPEG